ncbi:MAG: MBL fold metallo-hydrolase [Planctomycetaceae bacterium]
MRFENLDTSHRRPGLLNVLRWSVVDRLLRRRKPCPPGPPADSIAPDLALIHQPHGPPRLTWLGHASLLGCLDNQSFLVDPVFSPRIGLFYPRYAPPGLAAEQLPAIDCLLVTHNHYDHLDRRSVEQLDRNLTVIAPAGLGRWFFRFGFARIVELNWWEEATVGGLHVTSVPARHWSHRRPGDINKSHWCGYVIKGAGVSIYHAGDTAAFDGFQQIAARFPELDAALVPIAGYEPNWFMRHNHLDPEEAGAAFQHLNPRLCIPIHWGTFQMTDESLREPVDRLRKWWLSQTSLAPQQLQVLAIGQTLRLDTQT